jgi:hypothetical protein
MKSLISEMAKRFHEIVEESCEQCDRPKSNCACDEELDEQNVTGAIAGYNTPNAFTSEKNFKKKKFKYENVNTPPSYKFDSLHEPESDEEDQSDKNFAVGPNSSWHKESEEYPTDDRKLEKTSHMYKKVQETMDSKYEQLIESYRKFTTDDAKISPEQKVKKTIREVSKRLQEIEQLVTYSSRLKTESGLSRDGYGTSVNEALTKISERLTKIAERVRALGE